jgi:hypothetical protein
MKSIIRKTSILKGVLDGTIVFTSMLLMKPHILINLSAKNIVNVAAAVPGLLLIVLYTDIIYFKRLKGVTDS